MTDFVSLCRAARDLPGPDTHDRLWSAWFALQAWHFIKAPSPSGWMPYARYCNNERCVLGFTEPGRAEGYARYAALPIDPRVPSPVLTLHVEAMLQIVPQLRSWGVLGLMVDIGPDSFYTRLDTLFASYHRYRAAPTPAPPAPPPPPTNTLDSLLALPAWHLITTRDDPRFPDLAFCGTELVAQVYSSAQAVARFAGSPTPPTVVMPPREMISLLSEIELVGLVRFDGRLEIQLVDLGLHGR